MPTFDMACESCKTVREVRYPREPKLVCQCGQAMVRLYTLGSQQVTGFTPFWHPHLGHEPVYIDSWKTYATELHKRQKSNELASGGDPPGRWI